MESETVQYWRSLGYTECLDNGTVWLYKPDMGNTALCREYDGWESSRDIADCKGVVG